MFSFFKSSNHLKRFQVHLNSCHVIVSFTLGTEQYDKIAFLYILVIREGGKFTTNVCCKPTFSVYMSVFTVFLLKAYNFGIIYTLLNRCFQVSSEWLMPHSKLMLLKQIFQLSGYGENFIDLCLKSFSNKFHILKEKVPLAEKSLQLVRPYLGIISLQTRTKLHKKSLKGAVNYCKFQVFSKNQSKLKVSFASNVSILQIFTSGVVYKFQLGLCN